MSKQEKSLDELLKELHSSSVSKNITDELNSWLKTFNNKGDEKAYKHISSLIGKYSKNDISKRDILDIEFHLRCSLSN